ncbi:MAG TPA: TraR/DksA C4-type zinc finger protein [Dermatophilaceae bacterium]
MAVKKATSAKKNGSAPKAAPSMKGAAREAVKAPAVTVRAKATPSTRKAVPARGTATKSTARTTAAKTTAAKTTAAKTTAAKTAAAKTAAAKTAAAKTAAPPASRNARKTVKATSAKAQATAAPLRSHKIAASTSTARTQRLRVRQDEKPWTTRELEVVRAGLEADVARLHAEISAAESDLAGLMRDAGDGAGDDQADAGTKTFEREQEISLANNARVMFEQCQHALERIIHGSYGICESCGNPIGKNRLLAFPRATLCMPCKSKQERR